jgi:hypothetical protein
MNIAIASSVFGREAAIAFGALVVERHLHLAAAVAVEVAVLQHEVAAAPPLGMVAEDQAHRIRRAAARVDGFFE